MFHRVKSRLTLPCRYHRVRTWAWADPGKQLPTVTYRGDVNRREGGMGLRGRSFSCLGCGGDSQILSALCSRRFLWITGDLHFQMRVTGNLGGKSHKDEMALSKYLKEDN